MKIMKTLVIHPKDKSTDFLSVIYEDLNCTLIQDRVSKKILKEQIKSHDRIIMLGHGIERGLIGYQNPQTQLFRNPYLIIDSTFVYLLRDKSCVCIWCNADKFVEKYKLKAFYSGMIISEFNEAIDYAVTATPDEITESNLLFAKTIKKYINNVDIEKIKGEYLIKNNSVVNFNRENLYENSTYDEQSNKPSFKT